MSFQCALARIVRQNAGAESAFFTRFVCNTRFCLQNTLYTASILSNALQWRIVPTTEVEIGLSPAYRGRGLRAFGKYFSLHVCLQKVVVSCNLLLLLRYVWIRVMLSFIVYKLNLFIINLFNILDINRHLTSTIWGINNKGRYSKT